MWINKYPQLKIILLYSLLVIVLTIIGVLVTSRPAFIFDSIGDNKGWKFYVIGHAYGSHHNINPALDDRVITFIDKHQDLKKHPIFFAGDFIRDCTLENWMVLMGQFKMLKIEPFLARGTHERNRLCSTNIIERHGGLNYLLKTQDESKIVIVLDSENLHRSFKKDQIYFIRDNIANPKIKHVFIITHYVVWLSNHSRYGNYKANPGSRYENTKNSNYWRDLHPILASQTDKKIHLIAGDMGGRPDSQPAHYDQVDNVKFIASGLGEIDFNAILEILLLDGKTSINLVSLTPPYEKTSIEQYKWP